MYNGVELLDLALASYLAILFICGIADTRHNRLVQVVFRMREKAVANFLGASSAMTLRGRDISCTTEKVMAFLLSRAGAST